MKAIVEIDIPADYTDEYKQWVIDGRLYYLEDGTWTFLKEVECELKPTLKTISIDWIETWVITKFAGAGRVIDALLEDWEKENDKGSE